MRVAIVTACLALCATLGGCRMLGGGGAPDPAVAVGGNSRTYWYDMDVVWYAALAALDDMNLTRGFQKRDPNKGRIERRTDSGDKIRIDLTRYGTATEISVSINKLGNKALVPVVYDGIERHLADQGFAR